MEKETFKNLLLKAQCYTGEDMNCIGFDCLTEDYELSFVGWKSDDYQVKIHSFIHFKNDDWVELTPSEEQTDLLQNVIDDRLNDLRKSKDLDVLTKNIVFSKSLKRGISSLKRLIGWM